MIGAERARAGSEQLLVLWTWLLEGYVPVAHMVADLDEVATVQSSDSGDGPPRRTPYAAVRLVGKNAA